MAIIKQLSTGEECTLFPGFLIGRTHMASLRLESRLVSGEHASFRWTGSVWEVCDLGSSNGTFVDGKRLESGAHRALMEGTRLAFGEPAQGFEVLDVSPPEPMATTSANENVFGELGVLALPPSDEPLLLIHARSGKGWVAEANGDEPKPVKTGDSLTCDGQTYRLTLPVRWEPTLPSDEEPLMTQRIGLRFVAHSGARTTDITLLVPGREVPLRPRAHNEVLLELARQHLEDQQDPSLNPEDHGWVEVNELCDNICHISEYRLNLYVHRAREQMSRQGVMDPQRLIERHRGSSYDDKERRRWIRIGVSRLEIVT